MQENNLQLKVVRKWGKWTCKTYFDYGTMCTCEARRSKASTCDWVVGGDTNQGVAMKPEEIKKNLEEMLLKEGKELQKSIDTYVENSRRTIPILKEELLKLTKEELVAIVTSMTIVIGCSTHTTEFAGMQFAGMIAARIVGLDEMIQSQELLVKVSDLAQKRYKEDQVQKAQKN